MSTSQRNLGRQVGRTRHACVILSRSWRWPSVSASQLLPRFWMAQAWLIERQQAESAETRHVSRASGRPTASREPRTTRCVCRCTRWSEGLADATETEAMEYERAKHLETNAST